jgi:hypothetical protein
VTIQGHLHVRFIAALRLSPDEDGRNGLPCLVEPLHAVRADHGRAGFVCTAAQELAGFQQLGVYPQDLRLFVRR